MSGADSKSGGAQDGAQVVTQDPERPTGTIDLLQSIVREGPATLAPYEARRVLDYIGASERARGVLKIRADDAIRRAREARTQLEAYREAAAGREADLESEIARLSWQLRKGRIDVVWGLLEDVEHLYREGAGPDEWTRVMGRVGAALMAGGK